MGMQVALTILTIYALFLLVAGVGIALLMHYADDELKKIRDLLHTAVVTIRLKGVVFLVQENHSIVFRNVWATDIGHLAGWVSKTIGTRGIAKPLCRREKCPYEGTDACTDEHHLGLGPLKYKIRAPVYLTGPQQGRPGSVKQSTYNEIAAGTTRQYRGYKIKREGYRFWVPSVWQDLFDVVNMRPVSVSVDRDYEFNTGDNQEVLIKFRYVSQVIDPIAFQVRVGNDQRAAWEKEQVISMIQQMTNAYTADQLTGADDVQLGSLGQMLAEVYNFFMMAYGLQVSVIQILQISPPTVIAERAAHVRAAQLARKAAKAEGERIREIVDITGATPDEVVRAISYQNMVNQGSTTFIRVAEAIKDEFAAGRREAKKAKEKAA
ncbi:MAG: SPFH domain-containing protein [bacterium]|nr:SPFH domain-containing protein [bacterium]